MPYETPFISGSISHVRWLTGDRLIPEKNTDDEIQSVLNIERAIGEGLGFLAAATILEACAAEFEVRNAGLKRKEVDEVKYEFMSGGIDRLLLKADNLRMKGLELEGLAGEGNFLAIIRE